jgi:hypothetical protein
VILVSLWVFGIYHDVIQEYDAIAIVDVFAQEICNLPHVFTWCISQTNQHYQQLLQSIGSDEGRLLN